MKGKIAVLGAVLVSAGFFLGCATTAKSVESQEAAVETAAAQEQKEVSPTDYLGDGVFLAAVRFVSWEDTVCMAKVYPVKIAVPAGDATKGQSKIALTIRIKEAEDAPDGAWCWTRFVFKSHPAAPEEIAEGVWVLCVRNENPMVPDALKDSVWEYRQIKSTDELYKDLVEVAYFDTYYHIEKTYKVNVRNIRIVENPVVEDALNF